MSKPILSFVSFVSFVVKVRRASNEQVPGRFLRALLWIINAGRWLAPKSRRREWRRQWRADVWHEGRWLAQHQSGLVDRAGLIVRTAGALGHALWIRGHVRRVEMLYSLVSYLVAERTHEIGVRMALGADVSDVMRLVMGQGVTLALVGLAIGVPTALISSRLLSSLLYGVSPTDPAVFITLSAAILFVSAAACYAPARRATRLDPLAALRTE